MKECKKMKFFRTGLVLAASLLLWTPFQGTALAQHGGAPLQGGGIPSGITMQAVTGKVVQTMDSGGYTYALVEKDGVQTWVALPKSKIAVGDEISCRSGMVMNNFTSRSLQRTFDHIVFSGGLVSGGVSAPAAAAAQIQASSVTKAEGANAYTIGEIFDMKTSLANKPVKVKAKVVKTTGGIMGKNWMHLQDGTGSQSAGTNDLVVTTDADLPQVGAVVTVNGNLSVDRNFGSGYHYDAIIEGAEVTGE